jgi:hypothetical protein
MTSNPLADLIEATQLFVSRIACGDTYREAELSSGITAEVARTCAHLRRGGLEHICFGVSSRGVDVAIVAADIEASANAPTLDIAVREAALAWCGQQAQLHSC